MENQNKSLLKKWWFWILIFIIIVGIAANRNDVNKTTIAEETITNTQQKTENESNKGTIGNCYLEIGDFSITQDYSGNPILLVEISFTNNNDESKSFFSTIKDIAYQDGIEIKSPISTYGINNYDWQDKTKEIQKGTTFKFNLAYELSNKTSDAVIELTSYLNTKYNTK